MLSKKLHDALNAQVNAELWSAYLYLSMSVDASIKGHKGTANWFAIQFKEEQAHAQIIMNYILARGNEVKLAPIAKVKTSWASPLAAFQDTLEHEQKVTSMIHHLYEMATEEKDYATISMLSWFVSEQVEEEENAQEMIDILNQIGDSKPGIYMFDKELGGRTYTVPEPLAGKE